MNDETIKQCNNCASDGLTYSLNNGRPQVMISENYMSEARDGLSYMQQASALADMMAQGEVSPNLGNEAAHPSTPVELTPMFQPAIAANDWSARPKVGAPKLALGNFTLAETDAADVLGMQQQEDELDFLLACGEFTILEERTAVIRYLVPLQEYTSYGSANMFQDILERAKTAWQDDKGNLTQAGKDKAAEELRERISGLKTEEITETELSEVAEDSAGDWRCESPCVLTVSYRNVTEVDSGVVDERPRAMQGDPIEEILKVKDPDTGEEVKIPRIKRIGWIVAHVYVKWKFDVFVQCLR